MHKLLKLGICFAQSRVFMAKNLKELFYEGIVQLAKLPAKNEFDISRLDELDGYTVPLIGHDYAAKTPVMWNSVYEKLGLNLRNIMVVANPANVKSILDVLRRDEKYLGGGAGVGFKEVIIPYLDEKFPNDLLAANVIVKKDGRLVGYNTDAQGLLMSVQEALRKEGKGLEGRTCVVFGAGGVAKQFSRLLAQEGARRINIVNRTGKKAVALAAELSEAYACEAYGWPEDQIRGVVLNTIVPPDVIVNTTDKGSDGSLVDTCAFAEAGRYNQTHSVDVLRLLKHWNPRVVIVDVVLPKVMPSVTLRFAASVGLENLVDGIPMVINQACPAYKLIEVSYPEIHVRKLSESELVNVMRNSAVGV